MNALLLLLTLTAAPDARRPALTPAGPSAPSQTLLTPEPSFVAPTVTMFLAGLGTSATITWGAAVPAFLLNGVTSYGGRRTGGVDSEVYWTTLALSGAVTLALLAYSIYRFVELRHPRAEESSVAAATAPSR